MTEELFLQLCDHMSTNLWLQSLLIIVGTCFLEDAARCAVCLLVASSHVGWFLAFVSMTIGGMVGDIGLYLIGRYATAFLTRQRWIDIQRLLWMEDYFKNHSAKTIFIARFLPGARTIAFSAAGIVRYPFCRFLVWLFLAALVQALIFLKLGALIGDTILPYLKKPQTRAGIVAIIILCGIITHLIIMRRRRRNPTKSLLPILLNTDADKRTSAPQQTEHPDQKM